MRTKLRPPTPEEVVAARRAAGLTQTEAAQLVSNAGAKGYRTWQRYEAPETNSDSRAIPIGLWEYFLLLTDQHPSLRVIQK
ncbi:UDP-N-acetylenolpyruvoylglucosamine reductase [Novimethylophilus kurashikiensis]|uniref:UDP-N-acetylenolpyruvoylglucosamine reductase n=1 Tax=Novimethylophilus kurashikiensis TaxID=1825523 RepID=A0A2R5F9Z1_9PROT|nr:UDP-N-acetylenolpyruvoylglucosamine reductase [Novimethylophilus kurashikiensis]